MTEEQAKTKWCPMVRVSISGTKVALNRTGEVIFDNSGGAEFNSNCIGSDCLMWRVADGIPFRKDGTAAKYGDQDLVYKDSGYCGLAGKP